MDTLFVSDVPPVKCSIALDGTPPWIWMDLIEDELKYRLSNNMYDAISRDAYNARDKDSYRYNQYEVLDIHVWENAEKVHELLQYLRSYIRDTQEGTLLHDWVHYLSLSNCATLWLEAWKKNNPLELEDALCGHAYTIYLDLLSQCPDDARWSSLWEWIAPLCPVDSIPFLMEFLVEYPLDNPLANLPVAQLIQQQLPVLQSFIDHCSPTAPKSERRRHYQNLAQLFISSQHQPTTIDFPWEPQP